MTTADFTIGIGDTLPELKATLTPAPGQSFTLLGASVRFVASARSYNADTGQTSPRAIVIDKPAVIVDPDLLKVKYVFSAIDTAAFARLEGVFVVTFPGGDIESFPNSSSEKLRISIG